MLKNAVVYRLCGPLPLPEFAAIEEALGLTRFVPCGATEPRSLGWIEPRGQNHGPLLESVGGQLVLKLKVETKAVPAGVVKEQLEARLDQVERESGNRPRGRRKKELKEEVVLDLLPRAFSKTSTVPVWIDPQAALVVIGSGSAAAAEAVSAALIESFSRIGVALVLRRLNTRTAPGTAMAQWLATQEAPAGFTVDRECELKHTDDSGSTVRYVRHSLDIEEVVEHVRQGKLPTRLALTWGDRVSFVLTHDLTLRRIEILDAAVDGGAGNATPADKGEDNFDADVAILTGELSQLLPELVEALGGEQVEGVPVEGSGGAGNAGKGATAPQAKARGESVPDLPAAVEGSDVPPWEEPVAAQAQGRASSARTAAITPEAA